MSKHTPGPWKHHPQDYVGWVRGAWDEIVAGDRAVARVTRHDSEGEANARLIAVAPELLKMLKELLFLAQLASEDKWIELEALKLIAKVEGKE